MPNIFSGQIIANAPSAVSVGTSSTTVLAANFDRVGLVLVNASQSSINISLALDGATASLNNGIFLIGNGGAWSMDEFSYTKGAITAIASGSGATLTIQEFISKF